MLRSCDDVKGLQQKGKSRKKGVLRFVGVTKNTLFSPASNLSASRPINAMLFKEHNLHAKRLVFVFFGYFSGFEQVYMGTL